MGSFSITIGEKVQQRKMWKDMDKWNMQEGERIIIPPAQVSWCKSNSNSVKGELCLTTHRVVFQENRYNGFFDFFCKFFQPKRRYTITHSITLEQMATLRRGSLALHKNVLHIYTTDDIRYIYILAVDVQPWIDEFQKAKG